VAINSHVRTFPTSPKVLDVRLFVCVALRVEFLLKTESGYLRDAEVT